MAGPVQSSGLPAASSPLAAAAPSAAAANTYSDLSGLSALKNAPRSPQALHAVAQQIDALFLQMMLKSMRDASVDTAEAPSNELSMYQDMFDKQIALSLSQHQDMGLASAILRQLGGTPGSAAAVAGADPSGAGNARTPGAASAGGGGLASVRRATTVATTPAAAPGAGSSAPAARAAELPASAMTFAALRAALPTSAAAPAAAESTHAEDSTGAAAAAVAPASPVSAASRFVNAVLPAIRVAAGALGVSPLGMLAQAALETGWGQRMPRTASGASSLNLFGIKADDGWDGAKATATTVEIKGGVAKPQRASFRAYASIEQSVGDFANLLGNSPRYRAAVAAGASAHAYVAGIGKSGYASDPAYAAKLVKLMNSHAFREAVAASGIVL
jgi:flagellar protein FlgJ